MRFSRCSAVLVWRARTPQRLAGSQDDPRTRRTPLTTARRPPASFVQYVRRELPVGAVAVPERLPWDAPVGHATDQAFGAATEVRPGDTIWLVSWLLVGRERMPPSVDARIVVAADGGWSPAAVAALRAARARVFPATAASSWLPLLDASALFEALRVETRSGPRPLLRDPVSPTGRARVVGHRLALGARNLRRLAPRSARALADWARDRAARPVFVSYRWSDGEPAARALVTTLAAAGVPLWWDRWSVPRRLDELSPEQATPQLLAGLPGALERCHSAIRVRTPAYGSSRWTERESDWIEANKPFLDWDPQREPVSDLLLRVVAAR